MQTVEAWQWRICSGRGRYLRWDTTAYHATEAEIRARHPLAQRVDGTMQVREVLAERL